MVAESHDDISGFIRKRREIPASELHVLPYDALCHVIVWQRSSVVGSVPCHAFDLPVLKMLTTTIKHFNCLTYFVIALNNGWGF